MIIAFAALFLAASASAESPSDRVFHDAVRDINEAVAKIIESQAPKKQAQKPAAPAPKGSTPAKVSAKALACTPTQIDAAYAGLSYCEDAIRKSFGVNVRDYKNRLYTGFLPNMSLVLLTTTDAYFYHEDCDICAALERCSLKDGKLSNVITAHSVSCSDLAPLAAGRPVAFDACAPKP